MNVHTPERQAGESQQQYRERMSVSRAIATESRQGVNMRRVSASNKPPSKRDKHRAKVAAAKPAAHGPKPLVERKRTPKNPMKPTWPHTLNQAAQSRPVHNLNPNRERDPGARQKPKSAVAKRMDRPERVAMIERGHAKLMRFLGV